MSGRVNPLPSNLFTMSFNSTAGDANQACAFGWKLSNFLRTGDRARWAPTGLRTGILTSWSAASLSDSLPWLSCADSCRGLPLGLLHAHCLASLQCFPSRGSFESPGSGLCTSKTAPGGWHSNAPRLQNWCASSQRHYFAEKGFDKSI